MATPTEPLRQTLTSLEEEGRVLLVEVQKAERELEAKRRRAEQVEQAVKALRAVLGLDDDTSDTQEPVAPDSQRQAVPDIPSSDPSDGWAAPARPKTTRIKSTSEVVRIVREAERPLTRGQIQHAFRERDLVPPTWQHPANAINNAIARACERGDIRELEDGTFAVSGPSAPQAALTDRWGANRYELEGQR